MVRFSQQVHLSSPITWFSLLGFIVPLISIWVTFYWYWVSGSYLRYASIRPNIPYVSTAGTSLRYFFGGSLIFAAFVSLFIGVCNHYIFKHLINESKMINTKLKCKAMKLNERNKFLCFLCSFFLVGTGFFPIDTHNLLHMTFAGPWFLLNTYWIVTLDSICDIISMDKDILRYIHEKKNSSSLFKFQFSRRVMNLRRYSVPVLYILVFLFSIGQPPLWPKPTPDKQWPMILKEISAIAEYIVIHLYLITLAVFAGGVTQGSLRQVLPECIFNTIHVHDDGAGISSDSDSDSDDLYDPNESMFKVGSSSSSSSSNNNSSSVV